MGRKTIIPLEQGLWVEVLMRAIDDLNGREGATEAQQKDAAAWFSDQRTYIGSFAWVCYVLRLEETYVLRKIIPVQQTRAVGKPFKLPMIGNLKTAATRSEPPAPRLIVPCEFTPALSCEVTMTLPLRGQIEISHSDC